MPGILGKESKESEESRIRNGDVLTYHVPSEIGNSFDSFDSSDSYSLSSVTFFSSSRCLGVSPSTSTFWNLSSTSMPSTTLPKAVYWPSRPVASPRQMKNEVSALSG